MRLGVSVLLDGQALYPEHGSYSGKPYRLLLTQDLKRKLYDGCNFYRLFNDGVASWIVIGYSRLYPLDDVPHSYSTLGFEPYGRSPYK